MPNIRYVLCAHVHLYFLPTGGIFNKNLYLVYGLHKNVPLIYDVKSVPCLQNHVTRNFFEGGSIAVLLLPVVSALPSVLSCSTTS